MPYTEGVLIVSQMKGWSYQKLGAQADFSNLSEDALLIIPAEEGIICSKDAHQYILRSQACLLIASACTLLTIRT